MFEPVRAEVSMKSNLRTTHQQGLSQRREKRDRRVDAPFIIRQLLSFLLAHSSPFAISLVGQVAHVAHQQDGDILFCQASHIAQPAADMFEGRP